MATDPSYRIAIPSSSVKHFASLARRLSRIFAHAYFHHREIFESAEADNALYERYAPFLRVTFPRTMYYALLKIPIFIEKYFSDGPKQVPRSSAGVQPCAA